MNFSETKGMFWHIHHGRLCEWSDNIQERIDYIKKVKPKNEIEIRLKLMKPVKGKLPEEFVKASKARGKAWDKADKARDKAYKADKAWDKAWVKADKAWVKADKAWDKAWDKADKAWDKAWDKHKAKIEDLHKKECPNCTWNGTVITFEQNKKEGCEKIMLKILKLMEVKT